jgi:hypothetical protein
MPTTYTSGHGGSLQIEGTNIPIQNITIELSRAEIDVTSTADTTQISMAGRITRRVNCTAIVHADTHGALDVFFGSGATYGNIGLKGTLSFADSNGATYTWEVMLVTATITHDNQNVATVAMTLAEAEP